MLPKVNRLTKKSDFENVYQSGKFVSTPLFKVIFLQNKKEISRFGLIVSKKISTKAHERNKIKRIMREVVRKNIKNMKGGFDYVISAKVGILTATHATIESALVKSLK